MLRAARDMRLKSISCMMRVELRAPDAQSIQRRAGRPDGARWAINRLQFAAGCAHAQTTFTAPLHVCKQTGMNTTRSRRPTHLDWITRTSRAEEACISRRNTQLHRLAIRCRFNSDDYSKYVCLCSFGSNKIYAARMLRGSSNYRSIICCGPASDLSSKPAGRRWQLLSIDVTDTWTDGRILVLLDRFMTLTIILTEAYNAHNVEEISIRWRDVKINVWNICFMYFILFI